MVLIGYLAQSIDYDVLSHLFIHLGWIKRASRVPDQPSDGCADKQAERADASQPLSFHPRRESGFTVVVSHYLGDRFFFIFKRNDVTKTNKIT